MIEMLRKYANEKKGSLIVNSKPQGAKIYFDGKDTGKFTNALIENIPEGIHELFLSYGFPYKNWQGLIAVKANEITTINVIFQIGVKFIGKGEMPALWYTAPEGITVNEFGYVYVAARIMNRIEKYTIDGAFVTNIYIPLFSRQRGIEADQQGNLYVSAGFGPEWFDLERVNFEIQYGVWKLTSNGDYISRWGSYGSGDGQFNRPHGIGIDLAGNVFVADEGNHRIQKFTSNGDFITKWGSYGSGPSQFNRPFDVTVDTLGNIYVADESNHRIQKFDLNGNFILMWGSIGSGDGQFYYPTSVSADSSGHIYVTDSGNHRCQIFSSDGEFIGKWGFIGYEDGNFNYPSGIAIDKSNYVYVADFNNYRIQKFHV